MIWFRVRINSPQISPSKLILFYALLKRQQVKRDSERTFVRFILQYFGVPHTEWAKSRYTEIGYCILYSVYLLSAHSVLCDMLCSC